MADKGTKALAAKRRCGLNFLLCTKKGGGVILMESNGSVAAVTMTIIFCYQELALIKA